MHGHPEQSKITRPTQIVQKYLIRPLLSTVTPWSRCKLETYPCPSAQIAVFAIAQLVRPIEPRTSTLPLSVAAQASANASLAFRGRCANGWSVPTIARDEASV